MFRVRVLALVMLAASAQFSLADSVDSIEIRTAWETLETTLEREVFKDERRYYLEKADCTYALLERPELSAHNGRIFFQAHFSGRLATRVFGECIGPGEAFNVLFSGQPHVKGENLQLRDLRIEDVDSNLFRDILVDFLDDQLPQIISLNLGRELRYHLEKVNATSRYRVQLIELEIRDLRAEPHHLIMNVALKLDVALD